MVSKKSENVKNYELVRDYIMRAFNTIIFLIINLTIFGQSNKSFVIPKQKIDVFEILGDTSLNFSIDNIKMTRSFKPSLQIEIESFEMSNQITLADYKEYLKSIEKDSSQRYYYSQLPDSSILPRILYNNYLSDKDFENYPVIGISWDNAMNYCRWKTFKENDSDSLVFIYRLPYLSEWLSAYQYFEKHLDLKLTSEYADWLLNTKDSQPLDTDSIDFDYFYIDDNHNDIAVLLRKWVCGDNWFYSRNKLIDLFRYNNFYAFQGYNFVSFRYVKYEINLDTYKNDNHRHIYPIEYWILKQWTRKYNP